MKMLSAVSSAALVILAFLTVVTESTSSLMVIAAWGCVALYAVGEVVSRRRKPLELPSGVAEEPDEAERAELIRIRDGIGLVPAVRVYRERHPGVGLVESKRTVEAL